MYKKKPPIKPIQLPFSFAPSRDEFTPSLKITQDLFNGKNEDNNIDSFLITESASPRKQLSRHITILEEMGFGSAFTSHPSTQSHLERKLSRKASIGVSDFWSSQEKKKFLKDKGYWEAYKDMKKKDEVFILTSRKANHIPSLPHIMDLNTKRRIYLSNINSSNNSSKSQKSTQKKKKTLLIEDSIASTQKSPMNLKISILEKIADRCDNLTDETYQLKSSTDRFKKKFSKQCGNNSKKPEKRLSKYELKKIRIAADSFI